jgi:hypothetical protein
MNDLRKAAQMALHALEGTGTCPRDWPLQYGKEEEAIAALRKALANRPEPIAFMTHMPNGMLLHSRTSESDIPLHPWAPSNDVQGA